MEQTIKVFIYIHAFLGGLGLLTGIISIFIKKGDHIHKRLGKVFSYSIIISSLISLFVARMPNHKNLFLFLIGIFTIYLVLAGNRALTFKQKTKLRADWKDRLVSGSMLVTSIAMLLLGVVGMVQKMDNSALYLFFGGFGAFLPIRDFQSFKDFKEKKNAWLINHLGRMNGALIASITAFLVAGLNIQTLIIWLVPTILGVPYIIFWVKKISKNKNQTLSFNS